LENIMTKQDITVSHPDSIFDELAQRHEHIRQRAFELFMGRADGFRSDLDDWLNAERELFSIQPAIEMRENDGKIEIDADLPGMERKDLGVKVTSEDVLLTAEHAEKHEGSGKDAAKPDTMMRLFRAIHLPVTIDPAAAKAEYRKGHLIVTAPIMKPKPAMDVEVRA
jgi:HSP20 family protein